MKLWPVPKSYSRMVPIHGHPGSFWEDRGDRRHCGIDIYAPAGCPVLSIETGVVIDSGVFTSPDTVSYWNRTAYLVVRHQTEIVGKYAELGDVTVISGETVRVGQVLGHVGVVLQLEKIGEDSPRYLQKLKKQTCPSMLHFELYRSPPRESAEYSGGNWFGESQPKDLMDPSEYLRSTFGARRSEDAHI